MQIKTIGNGMENLQIIFWKNNFFFLENKEIKCIRKYPQIESEESKIPLLG